MDEREAFRLLDKRAASIFAIPYTDPRLKSSLAAYDEYRALSAPHGNIQVREFAENLILQQANKQIRRLEKHAKAATAVAQALNASSDTYKTWRALSAGVQNSISTAVSSINREIEQQNSDAAAHRTSKLFARTFVVSAEDREILQNPDQDFGDEFYEALARVRNIKTDCCGYLVSDGGQDSHLVKSSTSLLATAIENLRVSTAKILLECETNESRPSAKLRRRLAELNMQPFMLKATLETVIEQRKRRIARNFAETVTYSGGSKEAKIPNQPHKPSHTRRASGSSNPLEFFAYDPPRFLGMLMAWLHSAAVEEMDHFQLMIDPSLSGMQNDLPESLSIANTHEIIVDLVDSVLSSLDKPLRQRATQLAAGQNDLSQIINLAGIVEFYKYQLKRFGLSTLQVTLDKVVQALDQQYSRCLAVEVDLTRAALSGVRTVETPNAWREAMAGVHAILHSFENSVGFSTEEVKQASLERLYAYLDAFEKLCLELGTKLECREDSRVFILNCLDEEQLILATYPFMASRADRLQGQIDDLSQQLATILFENMRIASGLAAVTEGKTLDKSCFDGFLARGSIGECPSLLNLASPGIAGTVEQQTRQLFISACKTFESHLPRSLSEVALIL